MKAYLFLLLLPFLLVSCTESPKTENFDLVITNLNLVNISEGEITERSFVALRNDSVARIGKMEDFKKVHSEEVLNGKGLFLMPGLWDMHVHFRGGDSLITGNKSLLPLYLAHGVTTVRDAGGDFSWTVLEWKKQINNQQMLGPRIYTSGPKLDGANPAWDGSLMVESPGDVEIALDSLQKMGADYVKMYDGSLTPETFYSIIAKAEERGLKTTGHMPLKADFLTAMEHGLDGIEHMYYTVKASSPLADSLAKTELNYGMVPLLVDTYDEKLANEVFSKMARENVTITPTLHIGKVLAGLADADHSKDSLLAYIGEGIQETYQGRLERARKAKASGNRMRSKMGDLSRSMILPMNEAGVTILAGSDAGPFNSFVYPGASLHAELEELVEAGLTPQQALATSVINGPEFFGIEGGYGNIKTGMPADLILLKKNPLRDIKNTRSIEFVIANGQVHTPGELLESLK